MDNQKYLQELVDELMADTEWELPAQLRFPLVMDLAWTLIFL